ncbi:MAG: hypothetical protein ACLFV0_11300, partial [Nitriliruptoraceae bacterium]
LITLSAASAPPPAGPGEEVAAAVERFLDSRRAHLERARATITEAESADGWGLDALGVATRAVRQTVERRAARPS